MPKPTGLLKRRSKTVTNCFACRWRDQSLWSLLDQEDVRVLDEQKVCRLYQPGQIIFNQGDPCAGVYCVESGAVAIRKRDKHGNSALVRLRHAGEAASCQDFFAGHKFSTGAVAVAPSNVCFIPQATVQSLLGRNPSLGLRFLHRIAEDLRNAEETILQTVSLPIRTRLAHLLLTLKDRYATVDEEGVLTIDLPLGRQDLAANLGTRPETIARTIKALEGDNVAHFSGRVVVVPDLDVLLDEIEPDSFS